MGLLDGLLSGLIHGFVANSVNSMKQDKLRDDIEDMLDSAKESNLAPEEYVLANVGSTLAGIIRRKFDNPLELQEFLGTCLDTGALTETQIGVLWKACLKKVIPIRVEAARAYIRTPQTKYTLAPFLSGVVPANILEYCDSVADKPVLVETYLMQCHNSERIENYQYRILMELYMEIGKR